MKTLNLGPNENWYIAFSGGCLELYLAIGNTIDRWVGLSEIIPQVYKVTVDETHDNFCRVPNAFGDKIAYSFGFEVVRQDPNKIIQLKEGDWFSKCSGEIMINRGTLTTLPGNFNMDCWITRSPVQHLWLHESDGIARLKKEGYHVILPNGDAA